MIRYTENMKTTKDKEQSCNSATEFENICKTKKNIFEIVPSDKLIVPYFDVDFYTTFENYSEKEDKELLAAAKIAIIEGAYYAKYDKPQFAVATSSSKKYYCSKSNKQASKYSFHIVITNYKMYMCDILELVKKSNIVYSKLLPTSKFLINKKILDESPYKQGWQKLRTIYSTKPQENRYLTILEGTFYNFIICDVDNKINFYYEISEKSDNNDTDSEIDTDFEISFSFDESSMSPDLKQVYTYITLGVKHQIFQKMNGYDVWIKLGYIIKQTFKESPDGAKLFLLLSSHHEKYCPEEVFKIYDNLKLKDCKKTVGVATLIYLFKNADEEIYQKIKKDFNKSLDKDIQTINPEFVTSFDVEYFNKMCCSYELQKQYFELFVRLVTFPSPHFIYIMKEHDSNILVNSLSKNELQILFNNCMTSEIEESEKIKKVKFIEKWLADEKRKTCTSTEFKPYNGVFDLKQTFSERFNSFLGYNPLILTPFEKSEQNVILKPFKDIVLELCESNETYFNYMWKYLAHMIQKPNERIPIAFIIKSNQGVGKNLFLDTIGKVIGKKYYITSSDPEDFFDKHAEGFNNKLLVNINECVMKNTYKYESKLKSSITEKTIVINSKNVKPVEQANYARIIVFTNQLNALPIDFASKDRRYVIFEATDKYLQPCFNSSFWKNLVDHFEKPEFIACLYNDLNTTDLTCDWRSERPLTELYKRLCKSKSPVEALFFDEYIANFFNTNEWKQEIVKKNKEMYEAYCVFCHENGYINENYKLISITKFKQRLEELKIPVLFIKIHGYLSLKFKPIEIYNLLVAQQWIESHENE